MLPVLIIVLMAMSRGIQAGLVVEPPLSGSGTVESRLSELEQAVQEIRDALRELYPNLGML